MGNTDFFSLNRFLSFALIFAIEFLLWIYLTSLSPSCFLIFLNKSSAALLCFSILVFVDRITVLICGSFVLLCSVCSLTPWGKFQLPQSVYLCILELNFICFPRVKVIARFWPLLQGSLISFLWKDFKIKEEKEDELLQGQWHRRIGLDHQLAAVFEWRVVKNVDISVDLVMVTESACKPEKLSVSLRS